MVHLKEFQRDGKLFLFVVDKEEDKPQSGNYFRSTILWGSQRPIRCLLYSHCPFLLSFPSEWKKVRRMIQLGTSCRACITTSPAFSPNFLCLGTALYPSNPDGARTCFFMEILATFPCIGNWQSTCSFVLRRACEDVPYTRRCMPCFTCKAATCIFCLHFVRVGVLPPTLFTPYLERCPSPYGTCTGLAGS